MHIRSCAVLVLKTAGGGDKNFCHAFYIISCVSEIFWLSFFSGQKANTDTRVDRQSFRVAVRLLPTLQKFKQWKTLRKKHRSSKPYDAQRCIYISYIYSTYFDI